MPVTDLTDAERTVADAFPRGEWTDLGGRSIRAEVLTALILRGADGCDPPVDPVTRVGVNAAVPAVRLRDARVEGLLELSYADVAVPVWLDRCEFTAAPQLTGAATRTWDLSGCTLPGFEGRLLTVRGDLRLRDAVVTGRISLENAQISGTLVLSGARLSHPGARALSGGGLVVGGGLVGRHGLQVDGETRLIGARVDGGVLLEGARFSHPTGAALCLDDLVTNRLMCSDGFSTDGQFLLRAATVSGEVNLWGARLHAPDRALRARNLAAGELVLMPASVQGLVDLTRARVGALRDARDRWPARLRLDGLVYDHLLTVGPPADPQARCRWLARSDQPYRPQPYEQLAAYYRRLGHDDDARRVLLAKERNRRATVNPAARIGGYLLDWLVGYGYRPWLAGAWLAVLVALGTVVFSARPPVPLDATHHPHFSALIYTVDLLIPIGAFGLRGAYDPVGHTSWAADTLIAAGWVLATALVAGVSRTLGRD